MALIAPRAPETAPAPRGAPAPAATATRRRWPRIAGRVAIGVAILALLGAGAVFGERQIYFLGVDEGGRMALYRGLPYDMPLGISLYDERYSSPVQFDALPPGLQSNVTDHELRSHDDAASLIDEYEEVAETAGAEGAPTGGGGRAGGDGKQQGGKRQDKRGDGGGGRKQGG